MKKVISIILTIILSISCLSVFASCNNTEDANSFTWLLDGGEDATYYSSYNQNPVVLYTLSKEYAGTKLSIDFKSMVAGSETDQLNTMISTGEYYDVMAIMYSNYSAQALYEMGIALDITEYVEKYMPNYLSYVNSTPEIAMYAYNKNADGEKRMYSLWSCTDEEKYSFYGHCYRRDWIVKYGVNPQTGEPFTGGKTADGGWEDDVMFPSWYSDNKYVTEYKANHPDWDGTDPIFISDWEWMFEIFDKAREDLGITNDGYDISLSYVGYQGSGDLYSSFGGGSPMWSYDYESGNVTFNATSDSMKAYLECMNNWYNKGWLDDEFEQRTSDMFYKINTAAVYAGYVGMWDGVRATLLDQLEEDIYPATQGIYVYGAKLPINDIYGTEECKGHEPDARYESDRTAAQIIITQTAENKNLEALFTYLDSFYEVNGENTVAKNMGLTKEQFEVIKPLQETSNGKVFQERYGIEDGSYYIGEMEGHDVWYVPVDTLVSDNYLGNAAMGNRMFGLEMYKDKYNMPDEHYVFVNGYWDYYKNKCTISQSIVDMLSSEDTIQYSKTLTKYNDKMSSEIPKFIKGVYSLDGADWEAYCKTIDKMGHSKITKSLQELYDSFK